MRWTRRPAAACDDATLAAVYAGALAACGDEETAADIALKGWSAPRASARCRPVAEAVRPAVLDSPGPGFALLEPADREALALARLAGLDVAEIAAETRSTVAEVKARLNAGLRQLGGSLQCA